MKLTNKVAIVTAAGRGIGRSIALCLAEEGADVVVNSYSEDSTVRTAGEVQALGRSALAMPCDITKPDTITQVVQETLNTFGKIDILVNNVGAGPKKWKTTDAGSLSRWIDLWDNMYEQNLKAPVLMCEAVVPHLMEQKSGKIVNISSIAGARCTASKDARAHRTAVLQRNESRANQLHAITCRKARSVQYQRELCLPGYRLHGRLGEQFDTDGK